MNNCQTVTRKMPKENLKESLSGNKLDLSVSSMSVVPVKELVSEIEKTYKKLTQLTSEVTTTNHRHRHSDSQTICHKTDKSLMSQVTYVTISGLPVYVPK